MGEHTQPLRDRPASASSRAFWPRLLILALAIPPLLVLFDFARPTRRANECALCRLQKVDSRFLWFRRSETHPNKCSRWYQAHVEPTHTHLWAPCAHCERIGIPGIYGGYACSVGSRITGLSQTVQIDIYRHFKNPLEAKRFFVRLQQLDGTSENLHVWNSMSDWIDADYPGTWHGWWETHRDVVEGGDEPSA